MLCLDLPLYKSIITVIDDFSTTYYYDIVNQLHIFMTPLYHHEISIKSGLNPHSTASSRIFSASKARHRQGVTGGVDWHQIADPLIDGISPWLLGSPLLVDGKIHGAGAL